MSKHHKYGTAFSFLQCVPSGKRVGGQLRYPQLCYLCQARRQGPGELVGIKVKQR